MPLFLRHDFSAMDPDSVSGENDPRRNRFDRNSLNALFAAARCIPQRFVFEASSKICCMQSRTHIAGGTVAERFLSRATLQEAARTFLNDMAEVAGYGADRHGPMRKMSAYVMNRPILTVPDPWFFAGMVALEATKICDLFKPREADILMREILDEADRIAGRRGKRLSRLVLALIGRLGCGAVVLHTKVPDEKIPDVILLLMGDQNTWPHLLPDRSAHRQVRAAVRTGIPTWWADYQYNLARKPDEAADVEDDDTDFMSFAAPRDMDERVPEPAAA
jgi:hypothetical protein